jgi:hypothetical protein
VRVDDLEERHGGQDVARVAGREEQGERGQRAAVPVDGGGVAGHHVLVPGQFALGVGEDCLGVGDQLLGGGERLAGRHDLALLLLEIGLHLGGARLKLVERPAVEDRGGAARLVTRGSGGRTRHDEGSDERHRDGQRRW